MFEEMGIFEYHQHQRNRFKTGELVEEWYDKYSSIFDEQDANIARNQANLNYHFFEWLAAIILYQTFGFYCLVEQYEFKVHKRKQEILRKILSDDLFNLVINHTTHFTGVQGPDLFVYAPDYSEWFFCEVKGPGDRLTNVQIRYFNALSEITQKTIRIIRFKHHKRS